MIYQKWCLRKFHTGVHLIKLPNKEEVTFAISVINIETKKLETYLCVAEEPEEYSSI